MFFSIFETLQRKMKMVVDKEKIILKEKASKNVENELTVLKLIQVTNFPTIEISMYLW
jgi:hypothetical protein